MKKLLSFMLIFTLLICAPYCGAAFAEGTTADMAAVGDILTFGRYEQDNNPANGPEPIEWIVLETFADGILVFISRYALDCRPYHSSYTEVSWETSDLRKWLNEDFYSEAFSQSEQGEILTTTATNKDNPVTGAKGCGDTYDKVFLPDIEYAGSVINKKDMTCAPTELAVSRGADNGGGTCWWWLRSAGGSWYYAAYVDKNGSVIDYGDTVTYDTFGVRPMIAVKIALSDSKAAGGAENSIGEIVTFGRYEQDSVTSNGKEPIEWIILDVNDDGSLVLISKYALDAKPYNESSRAVTWETCSLREWLNEDFYSSAFNAEEQAKIKTVHLVNENNPSWGTTGGKDTDDRVWLLSINEVCDYFSTEKLYSYFTDDTSRMCAPTKYVIAQGVYQNSSYTVDDVGACKWWLRSPGSYSGDAAGVCLVGGGNVNSNGIPVNDDDFGVRPVVAVLP